MRINKRSNIPFCLALILLVVSASILLPASGRVDGAIDGVSRIVVIKAAHVLPMNGPEIQNGMVIVRDGKILAVGRDLNVPDGAEIIDGGGGWLLPGMIEAHTTFAMSGGYDRPDTDEATNPNTAHLNILDGFNPFSKSVKYTARAGVTASMITPGSRNVIGGQTAVIKHRGRTVEEMTIKSPAGVKFSLGEGPKETYGSKGQLPSTRMGSAYVVRKALLDAQHFLAQKITSEAKAAAAKSSSAAFPAKRDLNLEILSAVLEGKMTVFIECYRADDIMTALRLVDEFGLKAVLVGATEGYKLDDEIAMREVPVIVSPIGVGPRRMETQEASYTNAASLDRAGVKVIVKADEALGVGQVRELPLLAAFAVKGGMERDKALRAITLTAAEVLGVAERIGSLEVGKDADLVLFDGDPLHYRTRVRRVFIDGKEIPDVLK
ncbi:MAG: amidohydrolase family protein [Acidobacteria bacterium]|nr:amidohydrolase family protein [Acidobacteriota bacterium]MBU1474747.1 amidohydrolase family protein [Acidobacteriota bacterium]MBU2439283.1 amidohydrolase family protein [Acidobacteriota bacterium]